MTQQIGWLRAAAAGSLVFLCGTGFSRAQFHTKTETGQVVPTATGGTAAASAGGAMVYKGQYQTAGMIDTGAVQGARLGYLDYTSEMVWGRAIYHDDDSYTESKQDAETRSLTQETKSANGVTLVKRLISLDVKGNPSEILIYDGRGQFKYRGQILYDQMGRFVEERIYDTRNELMRQTLQKYDAQNKPLPLTTVVNQAKIPADLKLIITRNDGVTRDSRKAAENYAEFQRNAKEYRPGTADTPPQGAAPEPKKRGFFGKLLFGKE